MKIIPVKICYLCGKPTLPEQESNQDHVVPKALLTKKQPRTPGFDYGNKLTTHKACNGRFGQASSNTEVICKKALQLLDLLFDEKNYTKRFRNGDPDLGVLAIDSTRLKNFSKKDLEFFKINDVRDEEYTTWSNISHLQTLDQVDPRRIPMNTALTVLAKSAAALLVSRFEVLPDSTWRIAVYCGLDEDDSIDLDHHFGQTQPFDIGVKVWIKNVSARDYLVVYKHRKIIAFFHYSFADEAALFRVLPTIFAREHIVQYRSNCLIDMIGYDWFDNTL